MRIKLMRKFLASISARSEFVIVVALAFGWFIVVSLITAFHPVAAARHSNASLLGLAIYEIFLATLLAAFLHMRGWTFAKMGLVPNLKDTGIGVLLYLAAYALWIVVWMLTVRYSPQTAQTISTTQIVAHGLSPITAVTVSIINPVFEEVFVVGYVMTALKGGDGEWRAINVSVGLRLLYHLYQGPMGVLSIIPIGLLFSFWFARTGRLWPVIVAHGLMDLIGLLAYSHM
jgi:membrane protease YdiL (CAAX protease family)